MKKKDSIIEVVREKAPMIDPHIAELENIQSVPKSVHYRNKETGALYWAIAGGLSWPSPDNERLPGFAVIVAVEKNNNSEPTFRVLEEIENRDIEKLMRDCVEVRYKYGYWDSQDLLHRWYADYERYLSFLSSFSNKLQKEKGEAKGFYISLPADFERPNSDEIFLGRIRSLLEEDKFSRKRLYFDHCDRLRNHFLNLPKGPPLKSLAGHCPAVLALGYVVHSLALYKPWEVNLEMVKEEPTIDEIAFRENRLVLRDLRIDDYFFGETEEYDSECLVDTVID